MARVDQLVQERFGDDRVREQRIPALGARLAVIAFERLAAMRREISCRGRRLEWEWTTGQTRWSGEREDQLLTSKVTEIDLDARRKTTPEVTSKRLPQKPTQPHLLRRDRDLGKTGLVVCCAGI
ncbi:hypothetical protein ACFV47_43380 [Streptomyces solisilvae]|uniref:hypothetical protein n=1 Tax=Streptomyces malaysiensis TaxID=92644 RepID=UPI0036C05416